ncbi:MAG: glycine--tRNA ligase subunit beta [Candidatus Eisenbacteria bacterium]
MDFLLEIGVEELPASYIGPALEQLRGRIAAELEARRISCSSIRGLSTPRRLAVLARELPSRQEDCQREVIGPAARVAYDKDGLPTQAAKGFARSQGVPVEELVLRETEKGAYACAVVKEEGREVRKVLEEILPAVVLSVSFPKTMTWADPAVRFGRPIRWILALLDAEVVPFEAAGVRSDRCTAGGRFRAGQSIPLEHPREYVEKLRAAFVLADPLERRSLVERIASEEAKKKGGKLVEDPELVSIVSNLLEYPVAVVGTFDRGFLELPRDVVVIAMREHQRYFAVEDADGNLLPCFVAMGNGGTDGLDNVRLGNERVLKARLDDARFYWEKDITIGVQKQLELLRHVVWQESLGSLYEKSTRLAELSDFVVSCWDPSGAQAARRAGLLCKTDLVSEMVRDGKEFTTLQGIIGGEYARKAGEPEAVSRAVREHYLPRFPGDVLPNGFEGCAVGIADRLDEIVGCFCTGKIPTGSEDPYGLRRQANGVMRILIEKNLRFSLSKAVGKTFELLKNQFGSAHVSTADLEAFLAQRLSFVLSEKGIEQDVAASVLSRDWDDPRRSWLKAQAVARWKSNADFSSVVISFKRVSNILKGRSYATPEARQLTEAVERELLGKLREVSGLISREVEGGDYAAAIGRLVALKAPVDAFFDGVLVMDPDETVRTRRLGLLSLVRSEFLMLADFSQLCEAGGRDATEAG